MPYKTWALNDVLDSADVNTYIRDMQSTSVFIGAVNGTQAAPNGAWTAVSMQTEIIDTDGMHSTGAGVQYQVNPTYSGWYIMQGWVGLDHDAGGLTRQVTALLNNDVTTFYSAYRESLPSATYTCNLPLMSSPMFCNGTTDYMNASIYHDAGHNLAIVAGIIGVWRVGG